MSATTSIEWTDRRWNPVRGCSIVSPGCHRCYAMKQAHRFSGTRMERNGHGGQTLVKAPYYGLTRQTKAGPQWTGVARTVEDALPEPLSWRKPARVFVNSMSDLFHEDVPDAFIDNVFAVMALAPRHTFQILTKRAGRMREYLSSRTIGCSMTAEVYQSAYYVSEDNDAGQRVADCDWPLPNVWLGVSAEDQQRADERIPLLLQTPAAVRFVSAEPLLAPIDIRRHLDGHEEHGTPFDGAPHVGGCVGWTPPLDWVIVGGESGPGARLCSAQWVRSIVRQCKAARVPVFVKQMGANVIDRNDAGFDGCEPRSWPVAIEERDAVEHDIDGFREEYQGADVRIHLLDRKGGDPSEWPEDLRVREWPA